MQSGRLKTWRESCLQQQYPCLLWQQIMAGMQQVAGMAMQQSLSPQMQQSLHVLQAPLTELRQLVDAELRANPALEEISPEKPSTSETEKTSTLEDQWSEYYSQRSGGENWSKESLEKRQHFLDSQIRPPTLTEHLLEQLHTAAWPREDAEIAVEIIGNLDEGGYLRAELEEIASGRDVLPQEVERVLEKVQQFDPPGITSRNLAECLLSQLKAQGRGETALHREVFRPWGSYDSIDHGDRFQVKRLVVKPGASMSLQLHHHRAEHWIVVSGTARITRGEETFLLGENESTFIPMGTKHRIENPGKVTLHIIEVQSGSYLGEDDIVRFEDIYGREGSSK